jgi:hypothetical protein
MRLRPKTWVVLGTFLPLTAWADGVTLLRSQSFNTQSNCVVRQFYQNLLDDASLGVTLRKSLSDRDLLLSNGYDPKAPSQALRKPMVAMARNPEIRPNLVDSILADMRRKSDALSARIDQAEKSGKIDEASQVYDYVVVGTGVHDQIFNNIVSAKNPTLKGLSVGDGDAVSENFALADQFFRINSSNRATKAGVLPKPGEGNLNEFPGGIVQVPDIDPNRFPPARTLSDAATINRSVDSADILFHHRVKAVVPKDLAGLPGERWPARYQVELEDAAGNTKYVYTDRVVNAGGLGAPNIPVKDEKSRKLIYSAYNEIAKNPDSSTTMLSFEDAVRRAARTDHPYEAYAGKDIAIIGGRDVAKGDSAKVFIEWLAGFAPSAAYGKDTAQLGRFKSIDWVGISAKDCKEYINNTRARYADISIPFRDGNLKGVDGKLESVTQAADGKWELTYRLSNGRTKVVQKDVVIFATGYEPQSSSLYTSIATKDGNGRILDGKNPIQNSDLVEPVRKAVKGIADRPTIAKKIKNEDIYFVGPDAGTIVTQGEQAGVTENVASIFATGPRTAALAEDFAQQPARGLARFTEAPATPARYEEPSQIPVISRESDQRPVREPNQGTSIYLSNRINRELNTVLVDKETPIRINVTRVKAGSYAVTSDPPLAQMQKIAQDLSRDPAFLERVASYLEENRRSGQLSWQAVLEPKGRSKVRSFSVERPDSILAKQSGKLNYLEPYRSRTPRIYGEDTAAGAGTEKALRAILASPPTERSYQKLLTLSLSSDFSITKKEFEQILTSYKSITSDSRQILASELLRKVSDLNSETLVDVLKTSPNFNIRRRAAEAVFSLREPTAKDLVEVLKTLDGARDSDAARVDLATRLSPKLNLRGKDLVDILGTVTNQQLREKLATAVFGSIRYSAADDLVPVVRALEVSGQYLSKEGISFVDTELNRLYLDRSRWDALAEILPAIPPDQRGVIALNSFEGSARPTIDDLEKTVSALGPEVSGAKRDLIENFFTKNSNQFAERGLALAKTISDPKIREEAIGFFDSKLLSYASVTENDLKASRKNIKLFLDTGIERGKNWDPRAESIVGYAQRAEVPLDSFQEIAERLLRSGDAAATERVIRGIAPRVAVPNRRGLMGLTGSGGYRGLDGEDIATALRAGGTAATRKEYVLAAFGAIQSPTEADLQAVLKALRDKNVSYGEAQTALIEEYVSRIPGVSFDQINELFRYMGQYNSVNDSRVVTAVFKTIASPTDAQLRTVVKYAETARLALSDSLQPVYTEALAQGIARVPDLTSRTVAIGIDGIRDFAEARRLAIAGFKAIRSRTAADLGDIFAGGGYKLNDATKIQMIEDYVASGKRFTPEEAQRLKLLNPGIADVIDKYTQ